MTTPHPASHAAGGRKPVSPAVLDGPQGEPALVAEHLTKRFGDRVAFDDISFEVGYGEVFGFLGPNGAGKTTTVRTLGTLIAPSSGTAIVAGIPLSAKNGPLIRSRISVMPESPGLYLRLTVVENLQCFAGLYELDDVGGRMARALRAVNLDDRAGDLCGSLSKGLRQRVALARALLNDPAVLFLDEPTSGLDPVAIREVHGLIGTMAATPVLLIVLPTIQLIAANATGRNLSVHVGLSLLYMLVIPVMMPSAVSAYSVVGEREQGTLEPVLTTPVRREEFLIGKAVAAFVPTLVIAYAVFGIFLGAAELFAHPVIVSAIYAGTHVLVQLLFTPLLAGWAIWVGIAASARSTDVRGAAGHRPARLACRGGDVRP